MSSFTLVPYAYLPEKFQRLGAVEQIASTNLSEVYKISGEKNWALKKNRRPEPALMENARREIRILEQLSDCRRVMRAADSLEEPHGVDRADVYLLMPWLTPLTRWKKLALMNPSGLVGLVIQLCEALIECRDHGVYHLDIQPKNIFFDEEDQLVLGDFNSALTAEELEQNTRRRGTLAFLAPEVFRLHRCSEASEVYAVGMVLYSLIEGRFVPYPDRSQAELQTLRRLAGVPLRMFTACEPPTAALIYQTVRELTAFDPAERISTFEGAIEALERLRGQLKGSLDCWARWPDTDLFGDTELTYTLTIPRFSNTEDSSLPIWTGAGDHDCWSGDTDVDTPRPFDWPRDPEGLELS